MSLNRRDRAAMTLGLELCRAGESVGRVRSALAHGGPVAAGIAEDTYGIAMWEPLPIVRARLALALRVLLRVDAGCDGHEHAPRYFGDCGERFLDGWDTDCWGNWRRPLRVRPLWLDAPPHAAATGDRRDDSAARAAGGETR